jgi:transposase
MAFEEDRSVTKMAGPGPLPHLAFVAFDSAKVKHAVAIADDGRDGEVCYLGEIDNSPDAVRKLMAKLSRQYERLLFCYEAGPTGYGLHRQLTDLGHVCDVIAPTMIPKRSGDRVKTNRHQQHRCTAPAVRPAVGNPSVVLQ